MSARKKKPKPPPTRDEVFAHMREAIAATYSAGCMAKFDPALTPEDRAIIDALRRQAQGMLAVLNRQGRTQNGTSD